jgi:xylulokinase
MIAAYDIGTTVIKGAFLSENGDFLAYASRTLSMIETDAAGHYEADPQQWKQAFREITEHNLEQVGPGADVRAAIISGNGPTLVPLSHSGEFLSPVMSWMDRRGTAETAKIKEISGRYLDPTFYLPKALWLAKNRPDVYAETEHFLSCPESMLFWLTGEAVTILPGTHFLQYFWDDPLLESLGLEKTKFPEFSKPGKMIGKVSAAGASASGLPQNLPVISAGADFIVSLLGTGAVYPGRACDRAGTSEGINLCTEIEISDPRLMWYGHVVEPWYNISGIISTSGRAFDWIKDVTGAGMMRNDELDAEAAQSRPGADRLLFLPYLTGERAPLWDPNARGAFIGLGLNHTRKEMVRAVLESIGFAMRDVIEVMAEHGARIDDLRITGGPSKSALWNQIKADITGKNLLVPESTESELLGDLALALYGLGDTVDLAETADSIVKISKIYEPRKESRGLYDDMFGLYRDAYSGLKSIFSSLSRIDVIIKD